VDGILALLLRRDARTPAADVRGQVLRARRLLGALAGRVVLVGFHATRRSMDDQDTPIARLVEQLVHARRQFGAAPSRVETVMLVPHIADDESGFLGVPLGRANDGVEASAALLRLDAATQLKREFGG